MDMPAPHPSSASARDSAGAPSDSTRLSPFELARLLIDTCHKVVFLVPLVIAAVIARLDLAGAMPEKLAYRDAMELVALCVLGPALLLVTVLAARPETRSGPRLWVAALLATFFARELHFTGTSEGVYLGLLILLVVLVRHSGSWRSVLTSPRFATPLVAIFFCYFLSQSLDQRWWQFVPTEDEWHTRVEETLEVTGHSFGLVLAWLVPGRDHGHGGQ